MGFPSGSVAWQYLCDLEFFFFFARSGDDSHAEISVPGNVPSLWGSIGMAEGRGKGEISIWGAHNLHPSRPVSRAAASRPGLFRVNAFLDH